MNERALIHSSPSPENDVGPVKHHEVALTSNKTHHLSPHVMNGTHVLKRQIFDTAGMFLGNSMRSKIFRDHSQLESERT